MIDRFFTAVEKHGLSIMICLVVFIFVGAMTCAILASIVETFK